MNCWPAQRLCWPVIVPAGVQVGAGERRGTALSGIFPPSRRLYREKRKCTAPLDKSDRAVLYYWHEGMTLFARLLPLGLEHQEAKPLSGDHRMAALLISLLLVAAAIGHGGNYKRNNHTNHRQNLKISHDPFPLSPLLGGVRGRRKAKRHLLSFKPWGRFPAPWFYSIILICSCQSHRTILQYVCLDESFSCRAAF